MGPRVLTYHRPWNTGFFSYLTSLAFPDSQLRLITDFIGYAGDDLGLELRARYRSRVDEGASYDHDVTFRCRLLRALAPERAARFLSAIRESVRQVLDNHDPDVVFAQTVDSYVLDVLRIEAARRGIPYLGLIPSPVNGYVFLTARGEHHRFRSVDADEAAEAYGQFTSATYRPYYTPKASWRGSQQVLRMIRMQLRRPVNAARALVKRDPFNHHYMVARMLGRDLGRPGSIPRPRDFSENWQAAMRQKDRPAGFLPLQVWPEANSEYWLQYHDFIPYPDGVLRAIRGLRDTGTVIVKEHPQFVGLRQPWFRRALRAEPHVIMVPPSMPSRLVLDACDFSMVWSGSVAIESAVHGQPILDFGGTYLTNHAAATKISSADRLAAVSDSLSTVVKKGGLNADDCLDYMTRTLEGYLPGRAYVGRGFEDAGPAEMELVDQLGLSIREAYPSWRRLALADATASKSIL